MKLKTQDLRLQAVKIACQHSNNLPNALLHAKLIVDFVKTGQLISDSDYLSITELLSKPPTTGNDNETKTH